MIYKLAFREEALKEWKQLAPPVREQFQNKLYKRCNNPCMPADRLSGAKDRYKIQCVKWVFDWYMRCKAKCWQWL
ncbi:MAG: type II toxin-antitoxin system RelE family toxin [Neptuniibacter sp.]